MAVSVVVPDPAKVIPPVVLLAAVVTTPTVAAEVGPPPSSVTVGSVAYPVPGLVMTMLETVPPERTA